MPIFSPSPHQPWFGVQDYLFALRPILVRRLGRIPSTLDDILDQRFVQSRHRDQQEIQDVWDLLEHFLKIKL